MKTYNKKKYDIGSRISKYIICTESETKFQQYFTRFYYLERVIFPVQIRGSVHSRAPVSAKFEFMLRTGYINQLRGRANGGGARRHKENRQLAVCPLERARAPCAPTLLLHVAHPRMQPCTDVHSVPTLKSHAVH